MSIFGWDYPAGCSGTPYDEPAYCGICGKVEDNCSCPECQGCGEFGNEDCFGKAGHLPDAVVPIRSLQELWLEISGVKETNPEIALSHIEKALFKGTDCGICFSRAQNEPDGVIITGYAEGSDAELTSHTLDYPFTKEVFWDTVGRADDEGCEEWHMANPE